MALLQDPVAARVWYAWVSGVYDPVAATLLWPLSVQRAAVERAGVGAGDRVLDVGCGTGATSRLAAARGATVHGLDASRSQLLRAAAKPGLAGVRLVRGDAAALPYSDGCFDAVVSVGSVLYWPEPSTALRECRRVVGPGGRAVVLGFRRAAVAPWNPFATAVAAGYAGLFFCYDEATATALFERAGWTVVEHFRTGPAWHPRLAIGTVARA